MRTGLIKTTLAAALAFCAPALGWSQTKMIIGTGVDPSLSQFYVAKAGGFFEKNGLDVELNLGSSGSAMIPLVIGSQIQAALGGEQAGIQTHNLDPKVVIVGEAMRAPHWAGLVARDVADLDALKGKKIGVALGSGSEIFWLAMVKKLNLNVADYQVLNVEPPEMVAALERRDIDGFVGWEPWVTRATQGVEGTKVLRDNFEIIEPRNYIYMNSEWVGQNPDAAKAFVKSIVEATAYIKSNPDEAAKHVGETIKIDAELAKTLMAKINFHVQLTENSLEHLKGVEAQIAASGKLKKPVEWTGVFDTSLLQSADPASVSIKTE